MAPWNIRVSLVEPGGVKTEAPRQALLGTRSLKDTDAYRRYLQQAKMQMVESYQNSMEPEEVVKVIEEILLSENPHLHYPIGEFAKDRAEQRFQDPTGDSYVAFKNQLLAKSYLYDILGS